MQRKNYVIQISEDLSLRLQIKIHLGTFEILKKYRHFNGGSKLLQNRDRCTTTTTTF